MFPWQAMIGPLMPLLGKILLMIPIVPNKLIPAINAGLATAFRYIWLMGLPIESPQPVEGASAEVMLSGFGGQLGSILLSTLWSIGDQIMAGGFYEWRRMVAAKTGGRSWLEYGKRSIYGKKR